MNLPDINLYNTLLENEESYDTNSIDLEIINSMFESINIENICKYHDIPSYILSLPINCRDYLSIFHVNTRSLSKNYDKLISLLTSLPKFPDILCLSETWLKPDSAPLHDIPGFNSYHTFRHDGYGGVAVYVKDSIPSTPITEYCISDENIELCTIKVTVGSITYIISSLYRPHSKHHQIKEFSDLMDDLLSRDIFTNNKSIIAGDFNINLLEHNDHLPTNNFLSMMQSCNYFPCISRPTRFPDDNSTAAPSLLDHIWTNFTAPSSPGILFSPLSDHLPVFLNLPTVEKLNETHKISFRLMNNVNCAKFKAKLSEVHWNSLLSHHDTNTNCNLFLDTIYNIYYSSFPKITKQISTKRLHKPWITQGILKSIQHKFKLYKYYKLGIIGFDAYKQYRNYLTNLIKISKQNYYLQKFSNFRLSTKKIWETLNELSNSKTKTSSTTKSIVYKNRILDSKQEICEAFNDHFTSIAPTLAHKLPHTDTSPNSFLRGNYPQSMVVPLITTNDTEKVINALKTKKGHIDEIPVHIIKLNNKLFSIPLTILFNQSISTGTFPEKFKLAKIIPIHKTGSKTDLSNYRPISILSNFSKVFEHLMKNQLMLYLKKNDILNSRQFGFRPKLNTFDAINTFTSDLYTELNLNKSILSVFIDFSKAFDTVQPNILLNKMHHYGIRGCVHDWFSSYLKNRQQYTLWNSTLSTTKSVEIGVPQGSILGPILFLIYINDISNISDKLQTVLFADDSMFYMIGDNPAELINKTNIELKKFSSWCLANKLTVNTTKTHYMLFTKTITIHQPLPNLTILNENILQVDKIKFLGIIFDKNLTFKPHISNLCLRLSRIIPLLVKAKHIAPIKILQCLYYAHIYPHLTYCNPIWSQTYPCHLSQLNVLHKKIIRIITNSDFIEHSQPLFKRLNILNFADLSQYIIASFMYNKINSNNYNTQPIHTYQTRNQHSLYIPRPNLTLFKHSFMYSGPKFWNSIPKEIKESKSLSSFKIKLKSHMLRAY